MVQIRNSAKNDSFLKPKNMKDEVKSKVIKKEWGGTLISWNHSRKCHQFGERYGQQNTGGK